MRPLENYARSISQRAGRLRGGPNEPDAPAEVTDLDAQAVLLLSRQDLMSFAWPVPRHRGRYFVAIEQGRHRDGLQSEHRAQHPRARNSDTPSACGTTGTRRP